MTTEPLTAARRSEIRRHLDNRFDDAYDILAQEHAPDLLDEVERAREIITHLLEQEPCVTEDGVDLCYYCEEPLAAHHTKCPVQRAREYMDATR